MNEFTDAQIEQFLNEHGEETEAAEKQRDLRRAHQCHQTSCDSAAVYEVHLHIRYGRQHIAIEHLKSSIRCCDKHRRAAHDYLMSPNNKKLITEKLATIGRLGLDWDGVMVEFVPCGEEAWGPQNMTELKVA